MPMARKSPVSIGMDRNRRDALMSIGLSGLAGAATPSRALSAQLDGAEWSYTAPFPESVSRALISRLSDVLSVGDFGARGDGGADDTKAFQDAADAAASSGKALFVPATRRGYLRGLYL